MKVMDTLKLKFFMPYAVDSDAHFTIVNSDTNEESPVLSGVATIYSDTEGIKLKVKPELTDEQKTIVNGILKAHGNLIDIVKSMTPINNERPPQQTRHNRPLLERIRPPKPTKKMSRRYR